MKSEIIARDDPGAYLKRLGERVRETRARRGMTRRILARDSGVSERYLAQLESGQGNMSIARLRQVAQAMNLPLDELVREGPEPAVETVLLMQLVRRLDSRDVVAAHRMLMDQFARSGDRRHRIALIGLRGAGKSALGAALAESLGVPFVEMADAVARESGLSPGEIFELYGQAAYRRYERRALERAIESHPHAVIATGGSLVSEASTYEFLLNHCFTIWLKAAPADHMSRVMAQGDTRPIEASGEAMEDLERILAGRDALYRKAEAVVETSGRPFAESLDSLRDLCRTTARRAISP